MDLTVHKFDPKLLQLLGDEVKKPVSPERVERDDNDFIECTRHDCES